MAPRERELVLTRSGSIAGPGPAGGWVCDSATLPRAGRHPSRSSLSLSRSGAGPAESNHAGVADAPSGSTEMQSVSSNYATILQGEQQRDYPGTLGRGGLEMGSRFVVGRPEREGSIPLSAGMYPEGGGFIGDWHERVGITGYPLGRRDMTPQLLPYPGQGRGAFGGILGYGGAWPSAPDGSGRGAPVGGPHSLALRVGEFLRLRLAQVTFDPSQPPYDSVQVYGLEGTGSRAGSLSSLDSEGGKDAEKEVWGSGLEDWGPQFQKLAQLFREREKESGEDKDGDEEASKKHKDREWEEKEEQSGDEEQANVWESEKERGWVGQWLKGNKSWNNEKWRVRRERQRGKVIREDREKWTERAKAVERVIDAIWSNKCWKADVCAQSGVSLASI